MRKTILIATLIAAMAPPLAASAQTTCVEGRTAGGQCVNGRLAESTRLSAIVFSQPKLSQTALPVLPSQDAQYRYPHELVPNPAPLVGTGTPAPN